MKSTTITDKSLFDIDEDSSADEDDKDDEDDDFRCSASRRPSWKLSMKRASMSASIFTFGNRLGNERLRTKVIEELSPSICWRTFSILRHLSNPFFHNV